VSQQEDNGPARPAASPAATLAAHGAGERETGGQGAGRPGTGEPGTGEPELRRAARPWLREAAVLAGFLAAGIAATWPRAAYLTGRVPLGTDQAQYVWNMWWVAHQVTHLGNPWFTTYMAAPVGIQLGFDTLTPLLGVVMTPVTLVFGPSASYTLLSIVMPGLACYAMYRAARLWLASRLGAIAAGAFFGLSGMVTFQAWYHLHTAAGCVFLPLALETAVRLRRGPTIGRGVVLGVVLGASMLVDQEFSILAVIVAALVLIPWLVRRHGPAELRAAGTGAATALVIAGPQLIAMAQQAAGGGHRAPSVTEYVKFAAELPGLFAPSTRLARYGWTGVNSIYLQHTPTESLATFGLVLTLLAALGLAVSWRRRGGRLLGLLWLGSAALALGPTLYIRGHQFVPLAQRWHGLDVSLLMPYTWLIRLPGLSSFREADRLAFLGLIGAALLAGAAVEWLRRHARPALPVLAAVALLAALEAGWAGFPNQATMPTTLAAVDRPIAADHSGSVVVDVEFGIHGIPLYGKRISPLALVLATADGHPRAVSYTAWTPRKTITGISGHAFYAGLVAARLGQPITPAQIAAAQQDLRTLHVGWVLVWLPRWMLAGLQGTPHAHHFNYGAIEHYLTSTGFRFSYQAQGVAVYRP